MTPAHCSNLVRDYREQLSAPLLRFHFVSSREALAAKLAEDAKLLQDSGLPALETRLVEVASTAGRSEAAAEEAVCFAADFRAWLTRVCGAELAVRRMAGARVEWQQVLHHARQLEGAEGRFPNYRQRMAEALQINS